MKKIIPLLLFLFGCQVVAAQDWARLNRLRQQLADSRPDTARIGILLRMADFEILKTGEFKTDLDSATSYINDAEQLNGTVRSAEAKAYITIEKSYLARENHDMVTGKKLMEAAVNQLSGTGNKYLLGTAYLGLSDYYDNLKPDEQPKKQKYLEMAADIFKSGGYIEREAFCDRNLTEIMTDDDAAFKKIKEALRLYKSINYKKLQDIYDLIADYYIIHSDFKTALKYELIALNTAQEQDDHSGTLVEIENHLGIIYAHLGDSENQFRFFKMAIVVAKANGDIPSVVLLTLNVANTYLALNQPAKAKELLASLSKYDISRASTDNIVTFYRCKVKAYTLLGDFGQAETASNAMIPLLKSVALWPQTRCDSYVELVGYYLQSKQYANAKKYLLINDTLIKKLSSLVNLHSSAALWFRLDTGIHDYKSAVYRAIIQKRLADTIGKVNRIQDIQHIQDQSDAKQKQNQISFLEQKSLLESKNLQQANIVKDYTIAGVVLFFIIAGLLYRQNRLKQKTNNIISDKNALLQHLLTEKEWLLKEVHHRVKNNLHTVICLLESQAAYLENDALKAIETSRHRIYAMSLIHQKLYQSEDIKVIDMNLYLAEFVQYLNESFGSPEYVQVVLRAEKIQLGAAQAIPVGLIINEAVTNSFKYAFPNQRRGEIKIELETVSDEIYLAITDNGVGFKHDAGKELNSLGLELIKGLAQDLRGTISVETKNGTSIHLQFKIDPIGAVLENSVQQKV